MAELGHLRIGELSRRTGTSVDLLRAWEKRYGLLEPDRSDGGFRLYSDEDVGRVRTMQGHLAAGLAAKEAARRALEEPGSETDGVQLVAQSRRELADALAGFSEGRANAVLDRLLAALSVDAVLRDVVLPYLHDLGEAWERGEASIAQEHFREQRPPGPAARARARLGRGVGPARAARLPAARAARPRADRLRPGSAQPRLADHVSRPGHPALDARGGSAGAEPGPCRRRRLGCRAARRRPRPTSRGWLGPRRSRSAARAPRRELAEKAGASLLGGDPVSAAELLTRERRAGARARP